VDFQNIVYLLLFAIVLLDTVIGLGIFVPTSFILMGMGWFSATGMFNPFILLLITILGGLIGDNLNYYFGRRYAKKHLNKNLPFLQTTHFKKASAFLDKHHHYSFFFGRFFPNFRELLPFIFGMRTFKKSSKSSVITFRFWNMLGVFSWSLFYIFTGVLISILFEISKIWMSRVGFFLGVLFLIFTVFHILKVTLIRKGHDLLLFLISLLSSIGIAIKHNSDFKKLVKKYPKISRFIQKRLDAARFVGLPLTILIFFFIYNLSFLISLFSGVVQSNAINATDNRVLNLVYLFWDAGVLKIFYFISMLAQWEIALFFSLVLTFIFLIWKQKRYIFPFWLGLFATIATNISVKFIYHKVRPDVSFYTENLYSFPSMHASISLFFYGYLAYFFIKITRSWAYKINAFFIAILVIFLVGLSRLYLGVHFLSDVLGGYLIGINWLIVAIGFVVFSEYNKKSIKKPYVTEYRRIKTVLLVLTAGLYFALFSTYLSSKTDFSYVNREPISLLHTDNIFSIFDDDSKKYTERIMQDGSLRIQ